MSQHKANVLDSHSTEAGWQ